MTDMSAFRTVPQAEFKARDELQNAGFSAFIPTECRYRRVGAHRTRRTKVQVPMCPGYVFGSGKPSEARHVRNRIGALRKTDTVDDFKHLQSISGKEIDNEPRPVTWQPGEPAVIGSGPFEGSSVTVLEVRGKVAIVKGFVMNAEREQISIHVMQLLKKPPDAA